MCFCCCTTRKSILIYSIVTSSFAFIYGIVAISKFGSRTDIYKVLMEKIKALEQQSDYSSSSTKNNNNNLYDYYDDDYEYNSGYNSGYNNGYNNYNYNYGYKVKNKNNTIRRIDNNNINGYPYLYDDYYDNSKYAEALLNTASYINIMSLSKEEIQTKGYGFVKRLKGIENGLGVILFIFPLIFLAVEIVFLIFVCGIKEYKVLPDSTFNIFNIIKIICITLSTIFIFLSILYSVLLVVVLVQYIKLVVMIDSCAAGIIIGMVYGYYGLWYYIILACAFSHERTKFLTVGCQSKPGPDAKYDVNGNPLNSYGYNAQPIIVQQIPQQPIQVHSNIAPTPSNIKFSNDGGIGDTYITINNILYKRVNADSNSSNVPINIQRDEIKRNSNKRNSIRRDSNKKNTKKRHSIKQNNNIKRNSKGSIKINLNGENNQNSNNEENH